MNIVMKVLTASLESAFVLSVVISPLDTFNPVVWAWYSLCIILAFVLRLGIESKKRQLTARSLLYHSIFTISWTFFSILVWNTFLNYDKGYPIYLFINSLFATFFVSQFETVFKLGFKEWLRIKLGKFLAVEREEGTR